ncbi:MAG: GNAT family N-acetyltransferase, partial [Bacteroidota bacterium]
VMDNYQVKKLDWNDLILFEQLILVFREVFRSETILSFDEDHLANLLQNPTFVVYAVFHNEELVGGLTAYELPLYYLNKSELFIYDIAVKKEFQRKGLGKQLLLAVTVYCKDNHIENMFVVANEEDEHALDFYRSTGGTAEKVMLFNYSV